MMNVILNRENKLSDVSCGVFFYCLIKFNQKILIVSRFVTKNDFSHVIMTTGPKTINIKQYLSRRNFLVDNIYFVIKSLQTTQLYITKVFDTQFSCHDYMRKIIFRNKS
jgi:hypothetical protein